MTIGLESETSKDGKRICYFEWEKNNNYHVTAVERYASNSANAHVIQRSYNYADKNLARATYKRYVRKYIRDYDRQSDMLNI